MSGWSELRKVYEEVVAGNERALLFSLVAVEGSSYRKLGAHMLLTETGKRAGSVSAGCVESDLVTRVPELLARKLPQLLCYDNRGDDVFALNGGCTGALTILVREVSARTPEEGTGCSSAAINPIAAYIEASKRRQCVHVETNIDRNSPELGRCRFLNERNNGGLELASPYRYTQTIEPPIRLIVFGAQTDAFALLNLAANIDMETVVVDWRAALLSSYLQLGSKIKLQGDELASVSHDRRTAVVIMSHNYDQDRAALASMLDAPVGYLGVMGPRARTERMLAEIAEKLKLGGATAFGAPLHYPVGLDLGADNADEIAVAIIAEILSVFRQASGVSLAGKPAAIHAPVP